MGQCRQVNGRVCFVIDYHHALSALYGIFRELQSIVGLSFNLMKVMPEQPMTCFRRPRNLKDYLVQAKLSKVEETTGGIFKC